MNGPDTALIAACAAFPAALRAANATFADNAPEDEALRQVTATINDMPPLTIQGVIAKAAATHADAVSNYPGTGPKAEALQAECVSEWSWQIVNDLLRIGGVAIDHADDVLIAACGQFPAVFAAYVASDGDDGCPEDVAHTVACDLIDNNPPRTLAGLIAKARAAAFDNGPGGYGERWLDEIGRDLIRLDGDGWLDAIAAQAGWS